MATAENRLPKRVDGIDLRRLPIGPAEAFVLSCIDGASTEVEIAAAAGKSLADVQAVISRLVELGVVSLSAAPLRTPRVPRAAAATPLAGAAVEERVLRTEHPGASLYDAAELTEDVDIELERRKLILETFHRLENLNHYQLLGLAPDADRRAIKARYHEIINVFHPDRYYGKRLGSFKSKLERVFQRLTEAHDVLSRSGTRAEYDAYLKQGSSLSSLEQQLHDEEAHARELSAAHARIAAEASHARASVPPSATNSSLRPPQPSIPVIVESSRPSSADALATAVGSAGPASRVDPEARRRALARKLGFSSPPPASSTPLNGADAKVARERAVNDFKQRYEQHARRSQVSEYVARADAAIAAKKPVDAVNALRIAVSLAPEDASLRQRYEDVQAESSRELAERYLAQAAYEEREGHWAEAARSYARAVSANAAPAVHERLAHCLLMSQGDLKQAVEHARKAVLLAGNEARNRQTLARAYAAAEMRESALRELERAAALAPSDDTIREQLRRARRGEF